MKTKRKIDQKAIQQFFIDHTEKIVIGLVGLLFVLFTYNAVMLQLYGGYKSTPDEMQKVAAKAEATMQHGPTTLKPLPEPHYIEDIEKFKNPVDPTLYDIVTCPVWNPIAPRSLRPAPEVLAVKALQATPGRGPLAANGANAATVGQRWIVVTGLVPVAAQTIKFHDAFEGKADESNKEPKYYGFLVQRVEIPPGSKAEPNWDQAPMTLCNANTLKVQLAPWNGVGKEVVASQYLYDPAASPLASPLPPLAAGTWGGEVAHIPEIPLAPAGAVAGPDLPGGGHARLPIVPGGHRMPLPVRGGDTVADDPLGKTPDKADATKNKVDETAQTPDYYLLRYFDFDVEADKQYAYRVFVLLHNPNFGLDPKVLENEESAKSPLIGPVPGTEKRNDKDEIVGVTIESRYLEGWSKKCDSPKLPGDLRLLAGPTAPPKVPSPQEFTGEARILLWGEKLGLNQNCSKALQYRGTRLDFSNADMKTPGQTRTTKRDVPTNCLLVDLAGGELLSPRDRDRSPLSPGAMLVLDETGNLVIHDEMNDALEWTNATKEPERRGSERAPPVPRLKPGKAEIDTRGLDLKDQIRH